MGLITDVLLAPVTAPVHGLRLVLEAIQEQVDTDQRAEDMLVREQLVALNARLEQGEIGEREFEAQEAALLDRLAGRPARDNAAAPGASGPGGDAPAGAKGRSP